MVADVLALGVRIVPLAVLPVVGESAGEVGPVVVLGRPERLDDGTVAVVLARLAGLAAEVGEVLGHLQRPRHLGELDGSVGHAGAEEDRVAVVLVEAFRRRVTLAVLVGALDAPHGRRAGEDAEDRRAGAVDELRSGDADLSTRHRVAGVDRPDRVAVHREVEDLLVQEHGRVRFRFQERPTWRSPSGCERWPRDHRRPSRLADRCRSRRSRCRRAQAGSARPRRCSPRRDATSAPTEPVTPPPTIDHVERILGRRLVGKPAEATSPRVCIRTTTVDRFVAVEAEIDRVAPAVEAGEVVQCDIERAGVEVDRAGRLPHPVLPVGAELGGQPFASRATPRTGRGDAPAPSPSPAPTPNRCRTRPNSTTVRRVGDRTTAAMCQQVRRPHLGDELGVEHPPAVVVELLGLDQDVAARRFSHAQPLRLHRPPGRRGPSRSRERRPGGAGRDSSVWSGSTEAALRGKLLRQTVESVGLARQHPGGETPHQRELELAQPMTEFAACRHQAVPSVIDDMPSGASHGEIRPG